MRGPWHLWVVGVLSLLWNAGGAYDYIMMKTQNAAYLAMLTEEQLAFMTDVPVWYSVAWAVGVWGAVAGSALLLLRSRYASTAFWASLLGMLAATYRNFVLASPSALEISGSFALIFSGLIVVVAVFLIAYSRRMTSLGILR